MLVVVLVGAFATVVAACGGDTPATAAAARSALPPTSSSPSTAEGEALRPVSLRLRGALGTDAAGYFAATEQGFYEAAGLDVTMVAGGPDVIPQQAGSAADGPEFTISWVPKVLEARERQAGVGPRQHRPDLPALGHAVRVVEGHRTSRSPADFAGKKVGVWDFGNEFEVTAAGKKAGLEAGTDYEKVIQPFDMTPAPVERRSTSPRR